MYNEAIWFSTYKQTDKTDENGDHVLEEERTSLIFARIRSIGQSEFYQAQTNEFKPEIKFIIPDYLDYGGQEYLIHEHVRYKILRTFRNEQNEMEITCYGGIRNVSATISDENQ